MKNDQGAAQSTPELLPTQADRDATVALLVAFGRPAQYVRAVRNGEHDSGPTVQAFARHRIEHSTPSPVLEEVKEALEKARALIDCIEQCPRDARWWVNAFDPENAVCETSEAVSAALQTIGAGQ